MKSVTPKYILDFELDRLISAKSLDRHVIFFADIGKVICSFAYGYNNQMFLESGRKLECFPSSRQ